MAPIFFSIGSFHLYTYGLFVALGLLAATWVSKKLAAPHGIPSETISDLFIVILVSAIVGARLLYVLINLNGYKNNFWEIFKIWNGGLVFFGGFIAAAGATMIYLKQTRLNIWKMADILSPGIALGHAVGRIGCFFAGCCYGRECHLPFAVKFSNPDSLAPIGVYLHPTQIYSVISNLVLFFILLGIQKKKTVDGITFLSYLMLYSLFRSIIEFFRGDFRGDFFFEFISLSQGIGLFISMIALILLIKRIRFSYGSK